MVILTGLRINSAKFFSFLLVLALVFFFTLFLGQVLGRFYLANITTGEVQGDTIKRNFPSRGSSKDKEINKKRKVLRLKLLDYYTILVATAERQEEALHIGQELGRKGFPVIITGEGPYKVLLGFLNNREKLIPLAERIKVGGTKAQVISGSLNKVAFRFAADDTFAAEKIAPFLGKVSLCLEKGLFLYQSITIADEETTALRSKYILLANSLEETAHAGLQIAQEAKRGAENDLKNLSQLCKEWAQSLRLLNKEWSDVALLKGQQQGLALLDEYHRFLMKNN